MLFKVVNEGVRENLIREIQSRPLGFQVKIDDIKRTDPQNRFYWVVVGVIAKEIGYSPDELHESFKREFIGMHEGKDWFGNIYIRPKSSTGLKKAEFVEYMNKVLAFAASEGIKIPSPAYYGLDDY